MDYELVHLWLMGVGLTSGVKRNCMPLTEPFRVNPRIRKMRRTT